MTPVIKPGICAADPRACSSFLRHLLTSAMWDSPSLAVDLFPRRWPSPTLRAITNFVLNFSPWNFQISTVLRFFCCWCFKVGCKLPATPQKLIGVWKFISCAGATSDRERRKAAPRQVDHNLVSCFFFLHLIGEMSCFHLQLYLETPPNFGGRF